MGKSAFLYDIITGLKSSAHVLGMQDGKVVRVPKSILDLAGSEELQGDADLATQSPASPAVGDYYIATQTGTMQDFDQITVNRGEKIKYGSDGAWHAEPILATIDDSGLSGYLTGITTLQGLANKLDTLDLSAKSDLTMTEAQAIQLLRLHDPNLIFQGFTHSTSVPFPLTENHAWIADQDGGTGLEAIRGIDNVKKGQVIAVRSGSLVAENMASSSKPTYFFSFSSCVIDGSTITFSGFNFIYVYTSKNKITRYTIQNGTYNISGSNQALVIDLSLSGNLSPYVSTQQIHEIIDKNILILGVFDALGAFSILFDYGLSQRVTQLEGLQSRSVYANGNNYIEFTNSGSYMADGSINTGYGGFNKEIAISETGLYRVGWSLGGTVRKILAVDVSNNILATYNNSANEYNFFIDVPPGTVKLLATSYGTPRNGYLQKLKTSGENNYGYIKETRVSELASSAADTLIQKTNKSLFSNEPDYIEIQGNPWSDGKWKNAGASNTISKIYEVNDTDDYFIYYKPDLAYQMALSSSEINSQLSSEQSFGAITYNSKIINCLGSDLDQITVNSFSVEKKTITKFNFPAGTKRFILVTTEGGIKYNSIRLYKMSGGVGTYKNNVNSGKKIAVCGDSVAQNNETEIGKDKIRDLLGCKVDTYAMGGAGWSINATPTWVTPQNISGVYQVEELVKESAEAYDIYCLSCSLNDPITHNKAIGNYSDCKPYLLNGSDPDLTDPNLDTMCGALNFCIQRIYEKNPMAKIIIGTMNKCFLDVPTSGFDVQAGYDIYNTSTNSHGSTYYEYVQAVLQIAKIWGLQVVNVFSESNINELNKTQTMLDKYHPNEEGYKRIWAGWFNVIANC